MFPDNKLSSKPIRAEYADVVSRRTRPLIDYERGGILGQASDMTLQLWRLEYKDGAFFIYDEAENEHRIHEVPGVLGCSLAFDLAMQPHIAYRTAEGGFFWWYDSQTRVMVTTPYGNVTSIRTTLDERRAVESGISDIILSYTKDNNLYARIQRDRYGIEYLLKANCGGIMSALYLNKVGRLQWRLKPN